MTHAFRKRVPKKSNGARKRLSHSGKIKGHSAMAKERVRKQRNGKGK